MKESLSSSNQSTSDACCDPTESSACYEIPTCCDMRGLLSFQILWLLSKKPMHGQGIAEELLKRRGFKPSPGTLYPALKRLEGYSKEGKSYVKRGKKYIKRTKQGRKVIYHLAEEAKEELDQACRYFCYVFADIFAEYLGES